MKRTESVDSMKSFDPFAILDISFEADEKDIRRAFRKKSLETHPDKNPNDPLAASKFLQVTRAHQALTDEIARENYKKFGNPDGPGPMKVAIGLPYFLMKKENQIASLLISFLFILGVIPAAFFFWYSGSYIYTDQGIRQENEKIYAQGLNENFNFEDCPKLLTFAADFDEVSPKNKAEIEYLMKMNFSSLKNRGPSMNVKKGKILKNYKSHMLFVAYMHRIELPSQYSDLIKEIIAKVPSIIDLWLDISLQFHFAFKARRSRKNMTFTAMKKIIMFSQYSTHGLWEDHHELLQIPYMDDDKINQICRKMQKKKLTLNGKLQLFTATNLINKLV